MDPISQALFYWIPIVAFLAVFNQQKSPLIWFPARIVILNKPFRNIPSSLPVSAYILQFYWKMNTCVFQLSNELDLNLFIINLVICCLFDWLWTYLLSSIFKDPEQSIFLPTSFMFNRHLHWIIVIID